MVITLIDEEQSLIGPTCKHQWMIAPLNGPTSSGRSASAETNAILLTTQRRLRGDTRYL